MCGCLAAYREISLYAVSINAKLPQIILVETEHQCKITTCRMTADIHLARIASVLFNVLHYPSNGFRSVLCILWIVSSWVESVVRRDNRNALILQISRYILVSFCQSTAMKPYYGFEWTIGISRIV